MYKRNGCSVWHLNRSISEHEFKIYQRGAYAYGDEFVLKVGSNGTVSFSIFENNRL